MNEGDPQPQLLISNYLMGFLRYGMTIAVLFPFCQGVSNSNASLGEAKNERRSNLIFKHTCHY